jgi:tetratricopeptide (TPR) repeat protein
MKPVRTQLTANLLASAALLIFFLSIGKSEAATVQEQICDTKADYALGLEDYPAAIILHRKVLRSHPDDALAHYHLGFAYGMVGRDSDEIREYRTAVGLGLRQWDLFLDLGLAYLDQRDYPKAVKALETSVLLGPGHPESHFNLAIGYEKAGRLNDALKEIVASLQIAPADLDARNTKAIICVELGDLRCARDEWTLLTQIAPNYAPAQTNLTILTGVARAPLPTVPNTVEIPQLVESASWSNHQ